MNYDKYKEILEIFFKYGVMYGEEGYKIKHRKLTENERKEAFLIIFKY